MPLGGSGHEGGSHDDRRADVASERRGSDIRSRLVPLPARPSYRSLGRAIGEKKKR